MVCLTYSKLSPNPRKAPIPFKGSFLIFPSLLHTATLKYLHLSKQRCFPQPPHLHQIHLMPKGKKEINKNQQILFFPKCNEVHLSVLLGTKSWKVPITHNRSGGHHHLQVLRPPGSEPKSRLSTSQIDFFNTRSNSSAGAFHLQPVPIRRWTGNKSRPFLTRPSAFFNILKQTYNSLMSYTEGEHLKRL